MTNNNPNQTNEPNSDRSKQQSPRGVYNPIICGEESSQQSPFFAQLDSPLAKLFVGLLFAVIFTIAWARPEFSPLTIIVVVGCLLYRLEPWQRKLAAAPLLLAAIRFLLLLQAYTFGFSTHVSRANNLPGQWPEGDIGMPWVPAFLSVCLYFLPRKHSLLLKIVVGEALAVVLSSLLPAGGSMVILAIINYTMFFAVTIGLVVDLKSGLQVLFAERPAANAHYAVPVQPGSQPPRPAL
jgi:hypothetical protein